MANCSKCGKEIPEGVTTCVECSAADIGAKFRELNNTADSTASFDPADIQQNKAMAILAYIGLLVLIPIFAAANSKFARYHANQGLVLLLAGIVLNVAVGIVGSLLWMLYLGFVATILGWAARILTLVFMILGIVNAAQGAAKELPIIGKISILK